MNAHQVKAARNPGHRPDFTGAVQHFCVHPGARMIIDKVSEVRPVPGRDLSCRGAKP